MRREPLPGNMGENLSLTNLSTPGPMMARGDSLMCSRDPGSNYSTGLIAPRNYRPRCRRRRHRVPRFHALQVGQGPMGNYSANDRGDRGNVGIIRSPNRASILPDRCRHCSALLHSALIPDSLMIGHHFSISAF
jgi:hypothetical protein